MIEVELHTDMLLRALYFYLSSCFVYFNYVSWIHIQTCITIFGSSDTSSTICQVEMISGLFIVFICSDTLLFILLECRRPNLWVRVHCCIYLCCFFAISISLELEMLGWYEIYVESYGCCLSCCCFLDFVVGWF